MNERIRRLAAGHGVRQWQIAKTMGVAEETLCRWLRHELPEEKQALVLGAIRKLAKERINCDE